MAKTMPKSGLMMPYIVVNRDAAVSGVISVQGRSGNVLLDDFFVSKSVADDPITGYAKISDYYSKTESDGRYLQSAAPVLANNVALKADNNAGTDVDLIKVDATNIIHVGDLSSGVQGVNIYSEGRVATVNKDSTGAEVINPMYSKRYRPEIADMPFASIGTYEIDPITGRTIGVKDKDKGINSDIKVLNGLTTAITVSQGGTGAKTADTARTALGVNYGTTSGTVAQGNDARLNTVNNKSGGIITGNTSVVGNVNATVDSGSNTSANNISAGVFHSGYSGYLTPHYSEFQHRYDINWGSYSYITVCGGTAATTNYFRFLSNGQFITPLFKADGRSDFTKDVHMADTLSVEGMTYLNGGLSTKQITATGATIDSITAGYLGSTGRLAVNGTANVNELGVTTTLSVGGVSNLSGGANTSNLNASGTITSGAISSSKGIFGPGGNTVFIGDNQPTTVQGMFLDWNKPSFGGAGTLMVNRGQGAGGFYVRCLEANGTTAGSFIFYHNGDFATNGDVTVGAGTNTSARFYNTGNITGSSWASSAGGTNTVDLVTFLAKTYAPITPSDIKLKENITPSKAGAIDRINAIQTKEFDWKENRYGGRTRGFMAQDLEEIDPIYTFDKNDIKQFSTTALIADLIDSVKTLKARNEALEARVAELEKK